MPTRLTINGRSVWSGGGPGDVGERELRFTRRVKRNGAYVRELVDTTPVPPDAPASPLRLGLPYVDPDGVTYHVVERLDVLAGWAPAEYWMSRYRIRHRTLVALWLRGVFDAGMELGSAVKRFRCRDEAKVRAYLREHPKETRSRATVYRHRKKLGGDGWEEP